MIGRSAMAKGSLKQAFRQTSREVQRRLRGRTLGRPVAGAESAGGPHGIAFVAMIKNERPYLREWIEFHLMVGVDHFYIYDNNSTDGFEDVLEPYIAAGQVTLHRWPLHPDQLGCYNAALARYRQATRWLAFIDIDEFVTPTEGESLPDVLAPYEEFGALAVHWLMFSTSGRILRPDGLVTESYTRCQAGGNRHVKPFMRPERVAEVDTSHSVVCREPWFTVNTRRERVDGPYSTPPEIEPLRINHYWTKSVEEFFFAKLSRGEIDGISYLRDAEGLVMAEREYASGDDHEILRLVPGLRARLSEGRVTADRVTD
jgi:hypothetical protein